MQLNTLISAPFTISTPSLWLTSPLKRPCMESYLNMYAAYSVRTRVCVGGGSRKVRRGGHA